jgi:hypothetical protein
VTAFSLPETHEDKMVVEEYEAEDRKRKPVHQDPSTDGQPAKKKPRVDN